jgi:hypothetical protein
MDPSDMTLQAVLTRLINETQEQTGGVVDEVRMDHNIYKEFVDEVNHDFGFGQVVQVEEYKGVKIIPVTEIGTFVAVVRVESKMNNENGEEERK